MRGCGRGEHLPARGERNIGPYMVTGVTDCANEMEEESQIEYVELVTRNKSVVSAKENQTEHNTTEHNEKDNKSLSERKLKPAHGVQQISIDRGVLSSRVLPDTG